LNLDFGPEPITLPGVAPHAVDPRPARRLWELSERLIKAEGPAAIWV
jgi:hypothetical protein